MKNFIFILFILLVRVISAQNPLPNSQKNDNIGISGLTKTQWLEDIQFFKENLKTQHINPFSIYPADTFDNKINRLIQKVEQAKEINPFEILFDLQKIVWLTGDSHSKAEIYSNLKFTYFPLEINAFNDGYYITGILPENKVMLGKKITEINGIPIDTVIKKISNVYYFDNTSATKNWMPNWLINNELLSYLGVVKNNSMAITLKDSTSGMAQKITLEPKSYPEFAKTKVSIKRNSKPFTENKGIYYWKSIIGKDILFVQYNSCSTYEKSVTEDLKKLDTTKTSLEKRVFLLNNMIPFSDFSDSILAILGKPNIKRLVFDMRYNGGGSSIQGTKLIEQISKIDKINKNGKIYVLIGRKTFSSAILNTNDFKNMTKAILIGEPTGGKPNHFGEVKRFFLPNSKIIINYSTKKFTRVEGNPNTIEPDVRIEQTFNDYMQGIDPYLEYILKK